jgi:hypothetical protein
MVVLVEDAAESIFSSDVELVQSIRFDDRWAEWAEWAEWAKWSCGPQCAVCPMIVIERLEFAQDVQEVGLVQDEGAVEQFGSAGADPAFHDCVGPHRRLHLISMIGIAVSG